MPRRSSYAALLSTLALVAAGLVGTASPAQAAPPPNDNFASATPIGYGVFDVDNSEATMQSGEPQPSCTFEDPGTGLGDAEASVWYRFTAPSSGDVVMHTRDSVSEDTQVTVFTGDTLPTLAEVACSEDVGGSGGFRSEVVVPVTGGSVYHVRLTTWTDEADVHHQGPLTLTVLEPHDPPANDAFGSPQSVSTGTTDGTNLGATRQAGEPEASCLQEPAWATGASVWFSFTAPSDASMVFGTADSPAPFDTVVTVYTGNSLDGLTEVACGDDGGPANSSLAYGDVTAGTTYKIRVAGWAQTSTSVAATGDFTLTVQEGTPPPAGPPNDHIDQSEEIGPGVTNGSTVDATTDHTDAFVADSLGCSLERTIWYLYAPSSAGSATVDLVGSDFDTAMTFIEVDAEGVVGDFACNDNDGMSQTSRLQFEVESGMQYYLQVGSMAGQQGNVVLNLQGPGGGGGGGGGDPAVSGKAAKAPGTQIAYDLEIANTGDVFDGGILSIDPPAGVKVVDVSSEHIGCSSAAPFTCDVMSMLPEDVFTVTVLVTPKHEGPFRLDAELMPHGAMPFARDAKRSSASAAALADDPVNNTVSVTASRAVVCDNKATAKDNKAQGTAGGDILCGLGGGDTLKGLGGDDLIFGGDGSDSLLGAGGKDKLYGAAGADDIVGGAGSDVIDGGGGKDRCRESSDTQKSCER